DQQDYWAIAERDIEIQNPVTDRKLRLLDDYCDIRDGLRVLDVGCGKAWVLRQWAERFTIDGTGLETNRKFIDFARRKPPAKGKLSFVEGPADRFEAKPASYDVVMCLGAAFTLGGFVQAVDWMAAATKPGGALVIGDVTLRHRPEVYYHQHLPLDAVESLGVVQRHGADVSAMISASEADYERFVSHHRHSTLRWSRDNPDHPDRDDVLDKSNADWTDYLRTIRPLMGWTIFVGIKT
ncbi:MAG TPA: class I SAM-dependent methyltransferase, partial [Reyranella sp.]